MPAALLLALLSAAPSLDHALARYHDLDEAEAERELRALLETHPDPHTAAFAHVYLGIISMELEFDSARAEKEFRQAVALEPTVDIPLTAAPKERMIFLRAQREEIESETGAPNAAAPVQAVTAPGSAPRPSRTAAWWLGGSGAAAAVAGTVLGILAKGNQGTASEGSDGYTLHSGTTLSQYNTGQYEGLSADILWSVGGALVATAVIVALTSH